MEKKKINFLYGISGKARTVLMTSLSVEKGDVVRYRVLGEDALCEVQSVIATEEGSEIYDWILLATHCSDRKVTAVFRRDRQSQS